jgi:hypothetical protein
MKVMDFRKLVFLPPGALAVGLPGAKAQATIFHSKSVRFDDTKTTVVAKADQSPIGYCCLDDVLHDAPQFWMRPVTPRES